MKTGYKLKINLKDGEPLEFKSFVSEESMKEGLVLCRFFLGDNFKSANMYKIEFANKDPYLYELI